MSGTFYLVRNVEKYQTHACNWCCYGEYKLTELAHLHITDNKNILCIHCVSRWMQWRPYFRTCSYPQLSVCIHDGSSSIGEKTVLVWICVLGNRVKSSLKQAVISAIRIWTFYKHWILQYLKWLRNINAHVYVSTLQAIVETWYSHSYP